MNDPKILLTVAARGGSKGVENKNIRNLNGIPLIAHTLKQAQAWGRADKIICSTDSPQIAKIAREYGVEVPFMRPAELATDTAGKLDVLRHAVGAVEELSGKRFDVIVDLDATAPIRKVDDIERAYQLFEKNRPNCLFSVVPARKNPYFNMVEVNKKGYASLCKLPNVPILRRQDAPKVYDLNASIYVYDRKFLINKNTKTVISDKSIIYEMDEWGAVDIDTEADFQIIEYLLSQKIIHLQ